MAAFWVQEPFEGDSKRLSQIASLYDVRISRGTEVSDMMYLLTAFEPRHALQCTQDLEIFMTKRAIDVSRTHGLRRCNVQAIGVAVTIELPGSH